MTTPLLDPLAPMNVYCPVCGVPAGERCTRGVKRVESDTPHAGRIVAARRAGYFAPLCRHCLRPKRLCNCPLAVRRGAGGGGAEGGAT